MPGSGAMRYASRRRSALRSRADSAVWGGELGVEVQMDLAPAERTIMEMVGAAEDWREVWPEVGEWYASRERRVFETNSYNRWAPLRAATLVKKAREGHPRAVLVETGSLLRMVGSNAPRKAEPRFAIFGEPMGSTPTSKYGLFHATGRGVPQRNPIPNLTSAERVTVMRVLRDAYLQRVNRARA